MMSLNAHEIHQEIHVHFHTSHSFVQFIKGNSAKSSQCKCYFGTSWVYLMMTSGKRSVEHVALQC